MRLNARVRRLEQAEHDAGSRIVITPEDEKLASEIFLRCLAEAPQQMRVRYEQNPIDANAALLLQAEWQAG